MTKFQSAAQLAQDIRNLIDTYTKPGTLTLADAIGALEFVKLDLSIENLIAQREDPDGQDDT
jgi:hypothetical protein